MSLPSPLVLLRRVPRTASAAQGSPVNCWWSNLQIIYVNKLWTGSFLIFISLNVANIMIYATEAAARALVSAEILFHILLSWSVRTSATNVRHSNVFLLLIPPPTPPLLLLSTMCLNVHAISSIQHEMNDISAIIVPL